MRDHSEKQGFLRYAHLVVSEGYHEIVNVPVAHRTVSEQAAKSYSSDEYWTVDVEQIEGPKYSGRLQPFQFFRAGMQHSGCAPDDEPERVEKVLVTQVGKSVAGLVEKIVAFSGIGRLSGPVCAAQGDENLLHLPDHSSSARPYRSTDEIENHQRRSN